jgi:hypothetical protein
MTENTDNSNLLLRGEEFILTIWIEREKLEECSGSGTRGDVSTTLRFNKFTVSLVGGEIPVWCQYSADSSPLSEKRTTIYTVPLATDKYFCLCLLISTAITFFYKNSINASKTPITPLDPSASTPTTNEAPNKTE